LAQETIAPHGEYDKTICAGGGDAISCNHYCSSLLPLLFVLMMTSLLSLSASADFFVVVIFLFFFWLEFRRSNYASATFWGTEYGFLSFRIVSYNQSINQSIDQFIKQQRAKGHLLYKPRQYAIVIVHSVYNMTVWHRA